MERPWKDCGGLLRIFSVPDCAGARRFEDLCEMGALLKAHAPWYTLAHLERGFMREYGWSPLVYWSGMKRALRPLFQAGGDTLRALGVPVKGEPATVHDLAEAVAAAMAEDMGEVGKEEALQIAEHLRGCGL